MSRIKFILTVLEPILPSDYMKATLWKVRNICILKEIHNLLTKFATSNHGLITGKKYLLEKEEQGDKTSALSRQLLIFIINAHWSKVCQYMKEYTFLTSKYVSIMKHSGKQDFMFIEYRSSTYFTGIIHRICCFKKVRWTKKIYLLSMFNYASESLLDFFPSNIFNCLDIQDFL